MAILAPVSEGPGFKTYSISNAGDMTEALLINSGASVNIHATGFTGSINILLYAGDDAIADPFVDQNSVVLSIGGTSNFTGPFAVNYTAGGITAIAVKFVTATTGPALVTISEAANSQQFPDP